MQSDIDARLVVAEIMQLVLERAAEEDEWETTNERVVKWDEEQTAYLRARLARFADVPK